MRVELKREDDDKILLLPGRLEEEPGGKEEGSEGEDRGKELLSPVATSLPLPQAIVSPFG